MARKTWKDELWDFLEKISILYVFALFFIWFSDKELFFKLLGWGLAILGVLIAIIIFTQRFTKRSKIHKQSQWRTDRELLSWLRGLKPWEFERYIAELFTKLGYKTTVTGGAYDRGVDVIAEKDGLRHYIQCKKYMTSTVGVGELRDFYGAIADHLAQAKGYFITTNKFTLESERFAENKPIELIDSYKLIKYIRLSETSNQKVKN